MKFFFKNIILLSVLFFMLSLKSFTVINQSKTMIVVQFYMSNGFSHSPMDINVASGSTFAQNGNMFSFINIFNTMTQQWSTYNGIDDASIIRYNG